MTLHADARAVLGAWQPADPVQSSLRARFLAHLDRHPDGLLRSCFPDHVTASTVVLSPDGTSVLLTLHAKAGRWFQFGGHCEASDLSLLGAARREALEESGLDELAFDPVPVHLDAHEVPFCGREGATHLDVRFLAVSDGPTGSGVESGRDLTAPLPSAETLGVQWWPVDELPSDEDSLISLVAAARERLSRR